MSRRNPAAIDQEVAIVNAQLKILQSREDDFQRLVEDMQRMQASVRAERLALETKGRLLEAERHPINWLPNEILIHVFVALTEDVDNSSGESEIDELYHRSPVIISHVCQHWRSLAIGTSRLWSRISYKSIVWNRAPHRIFLQRSGAVPLDIVYGGPRSSSIEETRRFSRLLSDLSDHALRWRSFILQSRRTETLEKLLNILNSSAYEFPCLQSLDLSLVNPNTSFANTPSLMVRNIFGREIEEKDELPSWSCPLSHLRLEQVPLFNLPTHFLANLRSLELCFPPKKAATEWRSAYLLRMSFLCRFLALTPGLEDLMLTNTVPYFDAVLHIDDSEHSASGDGLTPTHPVALSCLKRINWSYPYTGDLHRFLSFLKVPLLEKLDIWLEEVPPKRGEILQLRGYQDPSAQTAATNRVLEYSSLRELSLQCVDEDTLGSCLRKFAFPVLEKVEIANVDIQARLPGDVSLPMLPRLESIFRDPRLPYLTHLTLSHFGIMGEHGRAMLGYMPVLTSLCLDTCLGVGKLLEGLQELGSSSIPGVAYDGVRRRPGVKVCPRLEALALWGCGDVEFEGLRAVVIARNRRSEGGRADDGVDAGTNGVGTNVTRNPKRGNGGEEVEETVIGRKIRPLRRLRRQGQAQGVRDGGLDSDSIPAVPPSANIMSSMIAMEEASRPAHIVYLRIEDCPSITEEDAVSLKDHGVVDVVWSGFGTRFE